MNGSDTSANMAGWQSLLIHNLTTGATVAIVATTCRSDFHIAETLWLLYPQ